MISKYIFTQSAGTVEYTDCIAETRVLNTTLNNLMVKLQ